jgi:galactitol PTS system EIIA component
VSNFVFNESVILLNLEGEKDSEIIQIMAENLVDQGLVKESFVPAILKREDEFPTGLPTEGVSVAIPHTDAEHVRKKTLSVGVLKQPVDFKIMGNNSKTTSVQLVFMLAMDKADSQLNLLQRLIEIFQNANLLRDILNQSNATDIKNLLEEKLEMVDFKGGEK